MDRVEREDLIATIAPRSFLFFVVADVGAPGPEGSHRPLAVTYRQGRFHGPGRDIEDEWRRVRQVVRDCARAVDVLTCPANRVAIEAELSLAAAEHRGRRCPEEPQRVQVPDLPQPSLTDRMFWHDRPPGGPEQAPPPESPPWVDAGAIREFPFISSCLRVALNRLDEDGSGARLDDVQERPLATVFRDDALEYGAVVIDISDLDAVRYGIVGSKINYVAAVGAVFGPWGWDRVESKYDGPPPELYLDNSGARTPLSAGAYMAKFGVDEVLDGVEQLEKHAIVEPRVLRYIWPPSSDSSIPDFPVRDHDAVVDEAVSALLRAETVDPEAHRDSLALPGFQSRLRGRLLEDPDKMRSSGASAQLLRLAYAGRRHLDWAAYRNLSYEHVATTLDSAQLSNAQALSICIDAMDDPPTPLLETLARHETIRDICFLQGPSRANDDKSSDLFSQICTSPFASALLGSRNIFVTCAFSAPLRRALWLRDPRTGARLDSPALRSAFPVRHMFVRKQFVPTEEVEEQDVMDFDEEEEEEEKEEEEEEEEGDTNVTFWPCHFFIGDMLLNPERFVSGFLQYCRWVIDDSFLMSFAAMASTLSAPRTEGPITPMPAENLAIPRRCSNLVSSSATADLSPAPNVERWPLFGPVEPGSWVVVVSHEWHTTRKTRKTRRQYLSWGYPGDSLIGVPIVRYAFLRARRRITLPDDAAAAAAGLGLGLEQLAGPNFVDVVGGVEAFLRETAPGVESLLVGDRVEETAGMLRARWQPGEWPNEGLPADMDLLTVLDDSAARAVFQDFLADAAHVRGKVPRDDAVFRSLDVKDTADVANPLGTQRRSTPPVVRYTPNKPTDEKSSSWIYGPPVIKQLRWKYDL